MLSASVSAAEVGSRPQSSDNKPTAAPVPAVVDKGITLRGLRRLAAHVRGLCEAGAFAEPFEEEGQTRPGARTFEELTTTQLVYGWIKKLPGSRRLTDIPTIIRPADVGRPLYFVSHAWKGSFAKLVSKVLSHLGSAPDTTLVWLDVAAINQHRDNPENGQDCAAFEAVLRVCGGGTIVVADMAWSASARVWLLNPALRAWCIFEWDHTVHVHGPDGLHLVGVDRRQLVAMASAIDVAASECFEPRDKDMILAKVTSHHGSPAAFDAALKLRLLLEPLSQKVDLLQLLRRSRAADWDLSAVDRWLQQDHIGAPASDASPPAPVPAPAPAPAPALPPLPRALLVLAGAGTGKSTIAATICHRLLGRPSRSRPGEWEGRVSAHYFLKHSDVRRLDPVRLVKTLAFQLSFRLPALQAHLLRLCSDPDTALQLLALSDACEACELLLSPLRACTEPVVILIDALDEGDPPEQQAPGYAGCVKACGNKALQLVLRDLAALPSCVRFIFTTRPDAVCGSVRATLERAFPGVLVLEPWQLRHVAGGSGSADHEGGDKSSGDIPCEATSAASQVLLYEAVASRAPSTAGPTKPAVTAAAGAKPAPRTLQDVYQLYTHVFDAALSSVAKVDVGVIRDLLAVLITAREPLPHAMLQHMGFGTALPSLPGWGTLFYDCEHHIYSLHKSLMDWLLDERLAGTHAIDARRGHLLLGLHLAEDAVEAGATRTPAPYALKYAVLHLAHAAIPPSNTTSSAAATGEDAATSSSTSRTDLTSSGARAAEQLDLALGNWEYIRAVFQGGHATHLVTALGAMPRNAMTHLAADTLAWLRQFYNEIAAEPQRLEHISLRTPPGQAFYRKAVALAQPAWVVAQELGGWGGAWPPWGLVLKEHTGYVAGVTFGPDSAQLASCSGDGTVKVWDLASGHCSATLTGHTDGAVNSVAFSPDRRHLASSGEDGTVRLWDLATGQCDRVLEGHTERVCGAAFSPGGAQIASCSDDKTVRLWDVASGSCVAMLEGHTEAVKSVAFSPDGSNLASGATDHTIRIWTIGVSGPQSGPDGQAQAKPRLILTGHMDSVVGLCFSPMDGARLASCSDDKTMRLWDLASGLCTATLEGHARIVTGLAFSPDGAHVASCSWDNVVRLWDTATGECQAALQGHAGYVLGVCYSPDGSRVASCGDDLTVKVWGVGPPPSPDSPGAGPAVVESRGDAAGELQGHSRAVTCVAFSPSGEALATCSADHSCRVWGLADGACTAVLEAHTDRARAVCYSPDGTWLASCSDDKTVRLWDLASGLCTATLEGHTERGWCLCVSRDGRWLASGGWDKSVRVWDAASGRCIATLLGHSRACSGVAFSPDGSLVASCSHDTTVRVWDVSTQECRALLEGHTAPTTGVAFSPDGTRLVSCGWDKVLKLWEVGGGGACMATLEGHTDNVNGVCFSPDGARLASCGDDLTVRLWDADSKSCVATLEGHTHFVMGVCFSPDGQRLASCAADKIVKVWEPNSEKAQA